MGEVIEIDANKAKALAFLEDMIAKLRENRLASFVMVAIAPDEGELAVERHYLADNPLSLVALIGATVCVQAEITTYARMELERG